MNPALEEVTSMDSRIRGAVTCPSSIPSRSASRVVFHAPFVTELCG